MVVVVVGVEIGGAQVPWQAEVVEAASGSQTTNLKYYVI
jgi:hypothetical protein